MANNKKYISLNRLSNFLDNLKNTFAAISHKHKISDLTDYKVDSQLSSTSTNPVQNKVLDAEFEAIGTAFDALELAIDGKADESHTHTIDNVTNLQSSLNAKVPTSRTVNGKALSANISLSASDVGAAPSSHNHDDRYYTEDEIDEKFEDYVPTARTVNGKALSSNITLSASDVGALPNTTPIPSIDGLATEEYVDDVASTKVDKVSGKGLSANDYTTTEKNKLSGIASGAEVNQNAFSNVVVGSTTIAADSKTDSLTIAAGTGISVSGDATNDKVTITNSGVRSIATGSSNGTISVNTNGTSANVAVKGLGSAAYTASTAYDAAGSADDALAASKEYTDSVASGKANTSHAHAISDVTNLQSTIDTINTEIDGSIKSLSVSGKTITYTKNDGTTGTITTQDTNTDTKVTNTLATTTKAYVTGTTSSSTNTGTQVFDTGVYLDTTEGQLVATTFKGALDGNAKTATSATSATSAASATKATQDGNGKVISSTYETKTDATAKLAEAKTYADNAATAVKNDLLNGAGDAYDTLKELGDLIDSNQDAIDAMETVAAGKADKTHGHAIADVSGLQSALDGKAASSHGTHVSYSTTAPVMDGTASAGSAGTVARSDHKHPTDTSRASKTEFDTHTANTTAHITSTERSNWNAAKTHADSAHAPSNAEKNQNAFSNITVGSTTVAADTATDTVTFVGSNVTITPDATNDKITFAVADGSTSAKGIVKLTNSTSSTSTTTAATPSSVKSAYDLANTAKTNAATAQSKADSAYTLAEGKVDSLSDLGITATATELNYVDGVTSNVQTQLDGKANTSHTHNYAGSSSAGGAATSANKVNASLTFNNGGSGAASGTTFDGSAAKTISYNTIGAAASSHTHDDRYYTESEIDTKVSTLNTAISGKAASSHTHSISNVSNLQSSLDDKVSKTNTGVQSIAGGLVVGGTSATATGKGRIMITGNTNPLVGLQAIDGGGNQLTPYYIQVSNDVLYLGPTSSMALSFDRSGNAVSPANLSIGGTISEGGTALSSKYASKATATTSAAGLMSAADKTKLDGLSATPAYTYGTEDLTAGTSALETGKLYFVYE